MRYKFPESMNLDYAPLKKFIEVNQELSKAELLNKCSGFISIELFQAIKELEFFAIGKDDEDVLYLV